MIYKQFDKVLDLAAKTGDKVIVMSESHDPYVVMTVTEYEGLLRNYDSVKNLSEEELLDKINRDIAVWKASQDDLDDYELSQFRVDSLKKEDTKKEEIKYDKLPASPDNDTSENINDEDKYYIEPVS